VDGEADAVLHLLRGESLAQALDAAPGLEFGQWLPMAVQSGLILSVNALKPGRH
jgi:hypothetical protein